MVNLGRDVLNLVHFLTAARSSLRMDSTRRSKNSVPLAFATTKFAFGWMKTVGMLRKARHRGVFKVGWVVTFMSSAYNLVRMRNPLFSAVPFA